MRSEYTPNLDEESAEGTGGDVLEHGEHRYRVEPGVIEREPLLREHVVVDQPNPVHQSGAGLDQLVEAHAFAERDGAEEERRPAAPDVQQSSVVIHVAEETTSHGRSPSREEPFQRSGAPRNALRLRHRLRGLAASAGAAAPAASRD
jgi:hypothetical protein